MYFTAKSCENACFSSISERENAVISNAFEAKIIQITQKIKVRVNHTFQKNIN